MFFLLILSLFILSGALGLGYQVIWSKYLLDFLGVSAYSYATVLAAFMAGLAIGSKLLGKYADRVSSPLKFYAYLEFGIAIYALIYSPLSTLFASLYGHLITFTPDQAGSSYGLWAKVLFSAALLLPPTILMGGTYPVLLRFVTQNESLIGKRASQLYAANAFGAVIGTLLMTFMLIPSLGMSASLMFLAIFNAIVALIAFLFSSRSTKVEAPVDSNIAVQKVAEFTPHQIRLGLLLIAIEGGIAFAYEIGWTRFFGLILGSSTYSFSVMLAALISGIAAGSALLSRLENKLQNPFDFLGWTQLLAALLVLIPLPFYPYLGWVFEQYSGLLSFREQAFYLYEFGKLLLCYLIMLPPTIFIGMALPLAVKGFSRTLSHLGQDTGRVYSWNTWGNVVGASLAGLFLLPLLGMEWLLRWTVIATLLVGAAFIFIFSSQSQRSLRLRIVPFAALLLITLFFPAWDLRWLTLVPFRRYDSPRPFDEIAKRLNAEQIKYAVDDPAAHVLIKETLSKPVTVSLLVNGKTDASNAQDMTTQVLSGHIPILLHPNPKDVLIIGLASGVTTGAVLKYPVQRADVVEIVRSMPHAARFFNPWNSNPFVDKRFRLIVDDARAYLSYTKQKYDIIISEPSNPWMAGTGALFSKDFYARAVNCLKEGGLYLQWLQAYELSDETFAAVLRSFRTVFPYIYAFQGRELDILFLGSRQELLPNWSVVEQRFNQPNIRDDLRRVRVEDLPSLLFLQRYSPGTADYIASVTDLENTDDNHLLEYRAPRDMFQRAKAAIVNEFDERQTASPSLFWSQYLHSTSQDNKLYKTLDLLDQPNMVSSAVLNSLRRSYYYINSTTYNPIVNPLEEMQTETSVALRIDRLIQAGEEQAALSYLNKQSAGIYFACALSKDHVSFWKDKILEWRQRATSKEFKAELRVFWIELVAASGDRQGALNELVNWVKSPSPPSESWAVVRGFQLDRKSAGPEILRFYFNRNPSPLLERLRLLSSSLR